MEYTIPDLNTISALSLASEINKIDFDTVDEMTLIANMGWVRPFGMLLTSIALKQLRNKHLDVPFRLQCDQSRTGISYAAHMGFFKSISETLPIGNVPGGASGNDNYLPITKLDLIKLHSDEIAAGEYGTLGDSIEKEAAKLSRIICRHNAEMQALMTYLIREILRNIPEHAEESSAWICGQYWNDQTAEIAIVDEGIGIKKSLQRNSIHRAYATDDESALSYAIKAGISQAFDPRRGNRSNDEWANSGYGLYMVSEICKELGGTFCIASGGKCIYATDKGIETIDTYLDGTAVKMTFPTDKLKSSHDIIREIAGRGECEARAIKNAFKKASHPSKGLILEL